MCRDLGHVCFNLYLLESIVSGNLLSIRDEDEGEEHPHPAKCVLSGVAPEADTPVLVPA